MIGRALRGGLIGGFPYLHPWVTLFSPCTHNKIRAETWEAQVDLDYEQHFL